MKGYNFHKMLKQAQDMQKQMESTQQELENIEVEGVAGGGVINIKFNAKNDPLAVKIKPEAINPDSPESVDEETIEMLEDLFLSALKDAKVKVDGLVEEKMSSVTGGLNLNIPGLF